MKKILVVFAAFLAAGCVGREEKAQDSALQFLDAFLHNDYERAAGCCADPLKENLIQATSRFNDLDSNVRALLVKECSKYEAEIISAGRVGKSDTVLVDYKIGDVEGTLSVLDDKIIRLGN